MYNNNGVNRPMISKLNYEISMKEIELSKNKETQMEIIEKRKGF